MRESFAYSITPAQLRMARAAVKIGIRELAREASVSPATITRFENEHGQMSVKSLEAVARVLSRQGIEFIPGGVRLRESGLTQESQD